MEMNNFAQATQNQIQSQKEEFRCKFCGTPLSQEDLFCPECGEKVGGAENTCPVCGTSSTSDFCPECGYRIIPAICPKCKNECHYDLCENCGEVINSMFQEVQKQEDNVAQVAMTKEEEAELDKCLAEPDCAEAEEFLKRIEKHNRMIKIKNFVDSREKRIVKVFGNSPLEYKIPDIEEEKFIAKAYEELNKVIKARDEEKQKKVIEEKFAEISQESKKKYEEIKAKSEAIIAGLKKDSQDAKVLEQKILEEERRIKAEEEAKKKMAEEEARRKVILGKYTWPGKRGLNMLWIKSYDGTNVEVYSQTDCSAKVHLLYQKCTGTLTGNTLKIKVISYKEGFGNCSCTTHKFQGRLNDSGNVIVGSWDRCDTHKYYKIN